LAFRDVTHRHGLAFKSGAEDRVIFDSNSTELTIQLERGQVFVDVGPRGASESFDLGEIILSKEPESRFRYADLATTSLVVELRRLAGLLSRYCDAMLSGDFSSGGAVLAFRERRFRDLTGQR
jgi:hypothetical protein